VTQVSEFYSPSVDLLCAVSVEGYLADVSPAWSELGWTAAQLTGRKYEDFIHPDDLFGMREGLARLAGGDTTVAFETRFSCPDDSFKWLAWQVTARPVQRDVAAVVRDVTESKRVASELERRNTFLELLHVVSVAANGAPTSLEHALQTTVDEVCRQTGWTVGHVLLPRGDSSDTLVSSGIWSADGAAARLAELRRRHDGTEFARDVGLPGRVYGTGRPEHIADIRLLAPGDADRVRCALIDAERMRAVGGFPIVIGEEVCGVLEFFSEVPFEADRLLLDVMAQVGMVLGRIVERTRYEAALRLAREVAEKANAAKSEFLSRMSHELRTPLTAVLGYTELLGLSHLSDRDGSYVGAIEKAGGHLLELINDVLDVARLEKGELRLTADPIDVSRTILEATALLEPLATANHVSLWTDLPRTIEHRALGDNHCLRQVVLNLGANAIKYNREEGTVVICVVDAGPDTVQIDIVDTGHGIAAQDIESIFLPFERLGAARTVEGTGLGLGISRQLVEAMGGRLEVHSVVGAGTTFSVVLRATKRRLQTTLSPGVQPPATPMVVADSTVLYVEDNPVNIELMQSIFTRLRPGTELVSILLGESAVSVARERRPQLILLDVNLPDIDGHEVLRRLQDDELTRAIPVVIVSADAIPAAIDRLLAAGASGYITKPIQVARLLEVVDHATAGSRPPLGRVGRLPALTA
jgi:PAS domain S-box-containing protein